MRNTLRRICELQKSYSSSNTEAMKERGQLIRQTLVAELRDELPAFSDSLGRYANDMNVEGSDGIGRKTEAPWTRIYSSKMSPSAREGFYIVFHFAADGTAVFVTIGCGSTIWKDGDLSAVSDEELASRTSWARQVIIDRWKTLDPFAKSMSLGAKADLPRTFEKATAISALNSIRRHRRRVSASFPLARSSSADRDL